MCFPLLSVFVMWLLVCYFVYRWGEESLLCLLFVLTLAVCLETFERIASYHNSNKQMEAFYVLSLVTLSSTVFEL